MHSNTCTVLQGHVQFRHFFIIYYFFTYIISPLFIFPPFIQMKDTKNNMYFAKFLNRVLEIILFYSIFAWLFIINTYYKIDHRMKEMWHTFRSW